jgi:hypothetical protein
MSTVINATLRLGAMLGAAIALYHTETRPGRTAVDCHRLTSSHCLQLVIRHSFLPPIAHVLIGALADLLLTAVPTLPLRIWQSLTRA